MGEKNVVLVLLAAGDGRRFHGNKLLEEFRGKPMYRCLTDEIASLPSSLFVRKLVVSQYPEILESLAEEGYETVENRESVLGISHSIQLALKQMDGSEDAVCFAVCDQPYLKGATIQALVDGWRASDKGMACVCHGGCDGNPTVFARKYEPALSLLSGDVGGKKVMRQFPDDIYRLEVEDGRELKDIDEKKELQELLVR